MWPKVFIKPGNNHVQEVGRNELCIDDGMGVITTVRLSKHPKSVNVAASRTTSDEGEYPHDQLTPQHPETVISGSRIRVSFR